MHRWYFTRSEITGLQWVHYSTCSSRQDDSGLKKLQDENKVLKDQLATQACMPQRSPQIGGPRLIIISTQNKHTVRAGPGAVSRETGATHRDEYRTSHTRRPTSI